MSKAHEGHRKLRNTGRALAVVGAGIVAARIASARRAPVDEQPDEPQPAPWAELGPVAPASPAKTVQPVDTPRADRSWESLRAPLLVSLAIILAATAVWFVEFHQRVDAATVQNAVALKNPGTTVGCVATSANGSQWECAVVRRADSNCVSLSASVLGRVSVGRTTPSRCISPGLQQMLPRHVTGEMVATDVAAMVGGAPFVCAPSNNGSSRWGCARSTVSQTQCVTVKVVPWTPMRPKDGHKLCSTIPYLRQAVIG